MYFRVWPLSPMPFRSEFCKRHGISPQLFYKFKNQMPATFRVGTRVLISREAAARWRAEREAINA